MVNIAIGNSRFEKYWNNTNFSWEELCKRLSTPIVTREKYISYLNLSKDKQSSIKDVGGFVGGELKNGARKRDTVKNRSILTLDLDNLTSMEEVYKIEKKLNTMGWAYCIYSTHKHSKKTPRIRLVGIFNKNIGPLEYEYISRRIGKIIGMDYIDHTTFQAERLMYWPSRSSDGDWYFSSNGNDCIDTKSLLANDWKDRNNWPMHPLENEIRIKEIGKRQQDPTTKTGFIGAFCKTYPISKVITELLPDVFIEGKENRYTYSQGTTANGAVVYDDLWLYSHHSTDPGSCQLLNAFDLLRIHKHGGSMNKTLEEIAKLSEVKEEMAKKDFGEDYADWKRDLERDKKGNITNKIDNLKKILINEFDVRYDLWSKNYLFSTEKWTQESKYIEDRDFDNFLEYIETTYNITSSMNRIVTAIKNTGDIKAFHPLKDYLESLKWDGISRVETLLCKCFGCENTKYIREITKKWLSAAIARIYKPGVKIDHVLTLAGTEDLGKSSFFRILAGEEYFTDSLTLYDMKDKTGCEKIIGSWIVELAELAGMKKADTETVKSFIVRNSDKYRPAFGRVVQIKERSCVFGATTNNIEGFLRDITGNRRYWIINDISKALDQEWLSANRDQIWAEVMQIWKKETLYLSGESKIIANKIQDSMLDSDDTYDLIKDFLLLPIPVNYYQLDIYDKREYIELALRKEKNIKYKELIERKEVCIGEIWHELLKKPIEDMNKLKTNSIKLILKKLGYIMTEKRYKYGMYGRQRLYSKYK